jgi:vancomycin resistance protein YoaR
MLLLKFQSTNNKVQINPKSKFSNLKLGFLSLIVFWILIFGFSAKSALAKTLEFGDQTWEVAPIFTKTTSPAIRNDVDLDLLSKNSLLGANLVHTAYSIDDQTATVINEAKKSIDTPAKNATLVLEDKFAKEFDPGQNGLGVDIWQLRNLLRSSDSNITLPVVTSSPTNKLSDTNPLGINELVATGESDFKGSPKNRIHNVTVGAEKFNGLIIDKGEEFSFNKYLGDVDGEHGFLPELVIKATGTVPEFGGGLCQVSSTAFRAAMNAGLPITARRNHSYAVSYYAPQGTDATIYPGVQDMKFINDTNGPLLIRTRIEGTKLYFDYYGTKDDRAVAFEGPVQYDRQTNGALKATWTRHVTKNGETITQVFKSNYQPPALFHKEEQKSTPNPETQQTALNQPITAGATTDANQSN